VQVWIPYDSVGKSPCSCRRGDLTPCCHDVMLAVEEGVCKEVRTDRRVRFLTYSELSETEVVVGRPVHYTYTERLCVLPTFRTIQEEL